MKRRLVITMVAMALNPITSVVLGCKLSPQSPPLTDTLGNLAETHEALALRMCPMLRRPNDKSPKALVTLFFSKDPGRNASFKVAGSVLEFVKQGKISKAFQTKDGGFFADVLISKPGPSWPATITLQMWTDLRYYSLRPKLFHSETDPAERIDTAVYSNGYLPPQASPTAADPSAFSIVRIRNKPKSGIVSLPRLSTVYDIRTDNFQAGRWTDTVIAMPAAQLHQPMTISFGRGVSKIVMTWSEKQPHNEKLPVICEICNRTSAKSMTPDDLEVVPLSPLAR